jgi:hypothetical protein
MGNGATCNSSGQWVNASSQEYKENISPLTAKEAFDALGNLKPVKYNFKRDTDKELNVGFIAEDVPELVATADRKGLSSLEIVAMLTKVVQDQQEIIEGQNGLIGALSDRVDQLEQAIEVNGNDKSL